MYYMAVLFRKLLNCWMSITAEESPDEETVYRSYWSKTLLWIGVDTIKMRELNAVAAIVVGLIMVI